MSSDFNVEAWMQWLVSHGLIKESEVPGMLKQIEAGEKVSVKLASGSRGKTRVHGNGTAIRFISNKK